MPIFEYVCQECGNKFEKLILSSRRRKALRCPSCGAENVEKSISMFSAGGGSVSLGSASASSCGTSG